MNALVILTASLVASAFAGNLGGGAGVLGPAGAGPGGPVLNGGGVGLGPGLGVAGGGLGDGLGGALAAGLGGGLGGPLRRGSRWWRGRLGRPSRVHRSRVRRRPRGRKPDSVHTSAGGDARGDSIFPEAARDTS
ncbi:acanthoscurrin-1-like [Rhipicephalus sanguineus]|uniref:acanthoscurrin-1-like n=1 Tax=Rhipicephalus sanguineus TaxID=34632 RepID=UPI0020C40FEF|nr:acanthoscurrin-1-like [Rhipicephalus sanguineus]